MQQFSQKKTFITFEWYDQEVKVENQTLLAKCQWQNLGNQKLGKEIYVQKL